MALIKKLWQLEAVNVALQDDGTTFADARTLFNAICKKHPSLIDRLYPKSSIVENHAFESGIVNVLNSAYIKLSVLKKSAVLHLKMEFLDEDDLQLTKSNSNSFALNVLNKHKKNMYF